LNNSNIRLFTPWSVLQILLALGAIYVIVAKLMYGLGAVTNLSDNWPWGLWIAFDVGVYIATAAGGFTIAALYYVFKIERFKPLAKPAVLIATLCYTIAAVGIFVDLGRSINIVHPIWMWQPESVMFEVGWCVMAYLTVLYLEVSPNVFQRFKYETLLKIQRFILIPLVIGGIILSFLHQSSLGALFMITPDQNALWNSPLMGYLFLVSAIAMGLALVTFFGIILARSWKMTLRMDVLSSVGKGIAWVLAVYLLARFAELFITGNIDAFNMETSGPGGYLGWLFIAEVGLFMALPMILLFSKLRKSPGWLITSTALVLIGVTLNRLNVLVISHAPARVGEYFPTWQEFLFTFGLIAGAMFVFRLAAKYLPIFEQQNAGLSEAVQKDPPKVIEA
jgi:Ni/Fe-hydrogenase subunit HybB-like protein